MRKILVLLLLCVGFFTMAAITFAEPVTTEPPTTTTITTFTTTAPVTEDEEGLADWATAFFEDFTIGKLVNVLYMVLAAFLAFISANSRVREYLAKKAEEKATGKSNSLLGTLEAVLGVLLNTNVVLNLIVQGSKLDTATKTQVAEMTVKTSQAIQSILNIFKGEKDETNVSGADFLNQIGAILDIAKQGTALVAGLGAPTITQKLGD